ncbi:MAG: thermonuclease family protein [Bacteroidetes bacterium]|nr:MAG: thermonuclease family protein [Bacteroidota bacterium]
MTRVIDGDTFETESGEKVRLIGINAPEMSDFYGLEAKRYLKNLVENKVVDLQTDNISNERDRYQRLLRYVIIDGIDVNKKMVSDGFAFAYLKYKFSKSDSYENAQIQAREMNLGIWGNSQSGVSQNQSFDESQEFWKTISPKAYFIISILALLIGIGLYSYLKK